MDQFYEKTGKVSNSNLGRPNNNFAPSNSEHGNKTSSRSNSGNSNTVDQPEGNPTLQDLNLLMSLSLLELVQVQETKRLTSTELSILSRTTRTLQAEETLGNQVNFYGRKPELD